MNAENMTPAEDARGSSVADRLAQKSPSRYLPRVNGTPPADDVREALALKISAHRHNSEVIWDEICGAWPWMRRATHSTFHEDDTGAWMDLARAVVREARS